MPTQIEEAVRRLSIVTTTDGVKEATDELNKLGQAYTGVTVNSQTTDKTSLSLDRTFNNLQRRFDATFRAQQDYEKVQRQVNAAVAQNPALQDRANQVLALAAQHYGNLSRAQQAAAVVTQDLSARVMATSNSIGLLGTVLTRLGPVGITVGVTVGAAALALKVMSDASHELAQKAEELRRFSEITGLTTLQVQALRTEASKFGVTSEEAQTAIQNFTARFNELRVGQGELLTQVRRINPALADQMAAARTAGDAMTLFGKALQNVDDVFQRNALVRAAAGRGGLSVASFFSGLNVDELTRSAEQADRALNEHLIKRLAQMEIEIQKSSANAKKNITSIFAEPILETESKFSAFLERISSKIRQAFPDGLPKITKDTFAQRFAPAIESPLAPFIPRSGPLQTPEFVTATLRAQISALGEAATFSQRLALAQQELAIKGHEAGLSQEQLAKAANVLNASFASQQLQARIGLLGELASVNEQVLATQLRVNLERAKGVKISDEETAAILRATRARAEAAKLQQQVQFGIFDPARQGANAQLELRTLIDNGTVKTADDYAAAVAVISKRLKDMSDQAAVARSALPQLTQLMLDAGNLSKQLDTFATSSLNNLTTALADIATGTATAGDAFRNFGKQVVRALDEMLIKMLIIQPLAKALGFGFNAFGGGGDGITTALGDFKPAFTAHTGGVVGLTPLASRYVHPAYFDGAPRFASGGIAGLGPDEIPIIAHRNEEIIRADDPRHRFNQPAGNGTLNQNITFKVEGAVSQDAITAMIRTGMAIAKREAVAAAAAGAPARQDRYNRLGT